MRICKYCGKKIHATSKRPSMLQAGVAKYVPQCRVGECIITQFHKSLFDCHVKGRPSIVEACHTPELVSRVVANRLVYVNNVNPTKVLRGFSVTPVAP